MMAFVKSQLASVVCMAHMYNVQNEIDYNRIRYCFYKRYLKSKQLSVKGFVNLLLHSWKSLSRLNIVLGELGNVQLVLLVVSGKGAQSLAHHSLISFFSSVGPQSLQDSTLVALV